MSTSIPSIPGAINVVPEESLTPVTSFDVNKQDAQAPDSGFSAVLADFMQAALPPELINPTLIDPASRQPGVTAASVSANTTATEPIAVRPDIASGNSLPIATPIVAWSGLLGLEDEQGASALRLTGDANQVLVGKPVHMTDLTTAMQRADQQALTRTLLPINGQSSGENFLLNQLQMATVQRQPPIANVTDGQAPSIVVDDNVLATLTNGEPSITSTPALTPYTATVRLDAAMANIAVPITHPNWNNSLSDSVKWIVQQQMQQADLRLNPPDLGVLDVRVQLNNNQTNITFSSPHAQVCDAVESALPRLREMFSQAGLQLADVSVNVSQQSLSQQHAQNGNSFPTGQGSGNTSAEATGDLLSQVASPLPRDGSGLVDVYA